MDQLGNNVWLSIINTIYIIHSTENMNDFANLVLRQIRWLIPYDRALFYCPSDNNEMINRPVSYNIDDEYIDLFIRNYKRYDYTMGLKIGGNSIVYKESDVVESNLWQQSNFYKEFCEPNGIRFLLQAVLCDQNQFCGNIILFRDTDSINGIDFNDKDMFILNLLRDHLALGVSRLEKSKLYETQGRALQSKNYPEDTDDNININKLSVKKCADKYNLTLREREILGLLVRSMTSEEICEELTISINTLKKHIFNIYKKLGINSRVQLFRMIED